MLKPVERPSRISKLGFTLFIEWVPPKSERPSSTSYVAGCDTTSRRAAGPTENSPENSPCPPASRFISFLLNENSSAHNHSEPQRMTTPRFARNQPPAPRAFRTALRAYEIKGALRAHPARSAARGNLNLGATSVRLLLKFPPWKNYD